MDQIKSEDELPDDFLKVVPWWLKILIGIAGTTAILLKAPLHTILPLFFWIVAIPMMLLFSRSIAVMNSRC